MTSPSGKVERPEIPDVPDLAEQEWDQLQDADLDAEEILPNGDIRDEDGTLDDDDENVQDSDEALPDDAEEAVLLRNPGKEEGRFDEV
jgi:hypothetical protein